MKFGVNFYPFSVFPNLPSLVNFAREADELGFDYICIGEHVAFPTEHNRSMGAVWWDPIVLGTHLCDVTKRVRLAYRVLVLPQHNPIRLAKQMATLDVISGGRIEVGVGSGWLEEEMRLMGADFDKRGAITDEYIRVMKTLWTTDPSEFHGDFLSFSDVSFHPKPVQRPHPPVHIGGKPVMAAKRAAALGDGWVPMGSPLDEFERGLATLKEAMRERGRSLDGFTITTHLPLFERSEESKDHMARSGSRLEGGFAGDFARAFDHIRRYEDLGVTNMTLILPPEYEAMRTEARRFADNVIQRR